MKVLVGNQVYDSTTVNITCRLSDMELQTLSEMAEKKHNLLHAEKPGGWSKSEEFNARQALAAGPIDLTFKPKPEIKRDNHTV